LKTTTELTALCATVLVVASTASNAALVSRLSGLAYYDDVLDVTWATNANINGQMTWDNAKLWASSLTLGGESGWRLPDMDINGDNTIEDCTIVDATTCADNEYGHLYHVQAITSGSQTPFSNIQSNQYWSGTAAPLSSSTNAYRFGFGSGNQGVSNQDIAKYAWAVKDGDVPVNAVPVPAAFWLFGSGLVGLIAVARRRRQG
jgi:hypothetical protein